MEGERKLAKDTVNSEENLDSVVSWIQEGGLLMAIINKGRIFFEVSVFYSYIYICIHLCVLKI